MVASAVAVIGFGIEIDFAVDSVDPARVFSAAGKLIGACQNFQSEVARGISSVDLEPYLVVEDIRYGSLLVWLKQKIKQLDPSLLIKVNEESLFSYLTQATKELLILGSDEITDHNLSNTQKRILEIAGSTDPTPVYPAYERIPKKEMLDSLKEMKDGVDMLDPGDKAKFVLPSSERISFSIATDFTEESIEKLLTNRTITNRTREILKIKSPDYLGDSQWKFKTDKVITAKMLDKDWVSEFKDGNIVLLPGDSIEAWVNSIRKYDIDMELVSESYEIEEVIRLHRAKSNGSIARQESIEGL